MIDVRTNLLKHRHTLSEKDYKRERDLLRSSIFTIVVVSLVLIAVSIWNLVLTQKLSEIEKGLTQSAKEMQKLTVASAQQVYLKSRLKLITSFLSERSVTRESIQKVFSTEIEGVNVSAVVFDSEQVLRIEYMADSVESLDRLNAYYKNNVDYFTQVTTSGLTRSKDGSYQMSLYLTLPIGGK